MDKLIEVDLKLLYTKYDLYAKIYPTDASFVIIGSYGYRIEYLIEGVGWRIIEEIIANKDVWTTTYICEKIESLVDLSDSFPDKFDCEVHFPTRI